VRRVGRHVRRRKLAGVRHVIGPFSAAANGGRWPTSFHFMSDNEHLKSFRNEALIFTVDGGSLLRKRLAAYVIVGFWLRTTSGAAWKGGHIGLRRSGNTS